jgi:hypothetical protein
MYHKETSKNNLWMFPFGHFQGKNRFFLFVVVMKKAVFRGAHNKLKGTVIVWIRGSRLPGHHLVKLSEEIPGIMRAGVRLRMVLY